VSSEPFLRFLDGPPALISAHHFVRPCHDNNQGLICVSGTDNLLFMDSVCRIIFNGARRFGRCSASVFRQGNTFLKKESEPAAKNSGFIKKLDIDKFQKSKSEPLGVEFLCDPTNL